MPGCSLGRPLRIAAKKFLANSVLAELLGQTIEAATGVDIAIQHHFGESSIVFGAFLAGEFDLYVENSGTLLRQQLRRIGDDAKSPRRLTLKGLNRAVVDDPRGIHARVLPSLGHSSNFMIVGRRDVADRLFPALASGRGEVLPTLTDLAVASRQRPITYLTTRNFYERPDGYFGLCEAYDLHLVLLESFVIHDEAAAALIAGKADFTEVYSTDTELEAFANQLVVLTDDREFFTDYAAHPILHEAVDRAAPEVGRAIERLADQVTEHDVRQMALPLVEAGVTSARLRDDDVARARLVDIVAAFRKRKGLS